MADEEDFDELDGILDSALAEFDIVASDGNSTAVFAPDLSDSSLRSPLADFASTATNDIVSSADRDVVFDPLPFPPIYDDSAGDRDGADERGADSDGVDGGAGDDAGGAGADDDGLRAFEDALKSLNALDVGGAGDATVGEHTEEEDMKLVEDFLKSLGSQFEGMRTPGAAAPGSAGTALGGNGQQEDDVSRSLESLLAGLGGAGSAADGGSVSRESGAGGASSAAGTEAGVDAGVGGGATPAGGPEFERIVESVVGELLSRDVLKGPMEQMRDAYAAWLPANEDSVGDTEAARFRKQESIVQRICTLYDGDACSTTAVMALLQEMQDTGAPPTDVMKQISDGDDGGSGAGGGDGAATELEKLVNCPVQ
jgi:Pex19 protein family